MGPLLTFLNLIRLELWQSRYFIPPLANWDLISVIKNVIFLHYTSEENDVQVCDICDTLHGVLHKHFTHLYKSKQKSTLNILPVWHLYSK